MDKESILDEAKRIVHGERGENYGHPFEDFSRTAKIWSAILEIEITPEQVALCMIGVKISREINRPKRDNIVDGAGYFETLDMVKSERKRRQPAVLTSKEEDEVERKIKEGKKVLKELRRQRLNHEEDRKTRLVEMSKETAEKYNFDDPSWDDNQYWLTWETKESRSYED